MEEQTVKMKPIWYFVGLVLTTMGGVVCIAGILDLISPPEHFPVLAELHSGVWWGVVMMVAGFIYIMFNRKRHVG
jgi:hypothetical protein